jgi:hypothetical protein
MCREHVKRRFVLVLVTSLGKQPVCPDKLKVSTTDLCAPMHKLATQASRTPNDKQYCIIDEKVNKWDYEAHMSYQ